jgi:hypothetical protein
MSRKKGSRRGNKGARQTRQVRKISTQKDRVLTEAINIPVKGARGSSPKWISSMVSLFNTFEIAVFMISIFSLPNNSIQENRFEGKVEARKYKQVD